MLSEVLIDQTDTVSVYGFIYTETDELQPNEPPQTTEHSRSCFKVESAAGASGRGTKSQKDEADHRPLSTDHSARDRGTRDSIVETTVHR